MYFVEINQTAVAGEWSFNTLHVTDSVCGQILIKADTATTTFDFRLIDEKSVIVYDTAYPDGDGITKTATGTLCDYVSIPVHGVYTLSLYNSSDLTETYTGRMMIPDG